MKKIFLIISLIVVTLIILSFTTYAIDELGKEIKLYLGETKVISVTVPTRIVIGNPGIVDVVNVTKNEIILSPKATGATTVVVWDSLGEETYRIKVFSENIYEVKRRVDNLLAKLNLPEVSTQAEEEEGKVILLGIVKSSQDKERIELAFGPLKAKTIDLIVVKEEEAVVEIEVLVLEVQRGAEKTLGIEWPTGTGTLTERFAKKTLATLPDAFFRISDWTRPAFTATVNFLVRDGKARILSQPRLACQSGKEAKLLVGGEVPIITAVVGESGVITGEVEYKEYGIILNIKPKVVEPGRIHLNLGVEVSEVGTAEETTYTKAYPLTKRNVSTELILDDGQTLAIGGLMKEKSSEELQKLPWLGNIPVLGVFFRKKATTVGGGATAKGDTELFITLTPTIVTKKPEAEVEKKEIKSEIVSPAVVKTLPEPIAGYVSVIQKRMLENLSYPALAEETGIAGKVKLGLHLSFQGELLEVIVKESSGNKILDEHALFIAKVITYPTFPPSITEKELWFDIPIVYDLD